MWEDPRREGPWLTISKDISISKAVYRNPIQPVLFLSPSFLVHAYCAYAAYLWSPGMPFHKHCLLASIPPPGTCPRNLSQEENEGRTFGGTHKVVENLCCCLPTHSMHICKELRKRSISNILFEVHSTVHPSI